MTDKKEVNIVRNYTFNPELYSQFSDFNYEQERTPIQERLYFLMLHGKLIRGQHEKLYSWADRIGLSKSTTFGLLKKGNLSMHQSVAQKISESTGANVDWVQNGIGQPFDNITSKTTCPKSATIEVEGLTITTSLDQEKLQQAFETTETALERQQRNMQPHPKADFIIMLYTALIDPETQSFNDTLLRTTIYTVENELEKQRRTMSPNKKTLLIMAIYTLYSGDTSNLEAIKETTIELIRSAA